MTHDTSIDLKKAYTICTHLPCLGMCTSETYFTVFLTQICSTELCSRIWGLLREKYAVLFRAPPFSGKSSLAHLFGRWAIANLPTALVIDLSLLGCGLDGKGDLVLAEKRFHSHWQLRAWDVRSSQKIGLSFIEAMTTASEERPTVLIIDEGQSAYTLSDQFILWHYIKMLLSPSSRIHIHLLMFSAYAEPVDNTTAAAAAAAAPPGSYAALPRLVTPVKFPVSLSIADIRLHKHECKWVFEQLHLLEASKFLCPVPSGTLCGPPLW